MDKLKHLMESDEPSKDVPVVQSTSLNQALDLLSDDDDSRLSADLKFILCSL